ncbi:methylaspartate mutase accessory protein GlmL [Anaeromicrobium sediminis]|uniref:MutL protein n=1 Tax=Anaeromicrobium sediminis TaxID=1478221 RepID=A0A267MKH9_9FIRM|nr:methylaspartate mutase accessory protein GlmL [Anaeromicrobium sediminis]PAB60079.1 MutL protein [Anaeromicrobium sediminis]
MKCVQLVDFGSTFTKLTLVDIHNNVIIGTSKAPTTVKTNIMEGYYEAKSILDDSVDLNNPEIIDILVCSSAAGGLNMVASGLVKDLTTKAAKMTVLGAGAKVLDVYDQKLSKRKIQKIIEQNPDMILLAGGTNGGNVSCIVHNAKIISTHMKDIPLVIAGNEDSHYEIEEILEREGIHYKLTDNIMPELNTIHIDSAREAIREIFMEKIVEAKGLKNIQENLNEEVIPTPLAVQRAVELYAKANNKADVAVVDIGGATTDIHSACDGGPTKVGATLTGLKEPYLKRTVEGDLGMRVSALSLLETVGPSALGALIEEGSKDENYIKEKCRELTINPENISTCEEDKSFDRAMASLATKVAMSRHVGILEKVYYPMGSVMFQRGKDLSNVKLLIGTGGILVHNEDPETILKSCLYDEKEPHILKPINPKLMIDKDYILSAAGLLSKKYPNTAIKIMDEHLIEIGGATNGTEK